MRFHQLSRRYPHPPDDFRTVPSPKIAPCIFSAFTTVVYDIKWSREANSAATFHSNYHSQPRSVCGSASNQHAPLTPLSIVRPYCTYCLLCPLPSPVCRGVCYWMLMPFSYIKPPACTVSVSYWRLVHAGKGLSRRSFISSGPYAQCAHCAYRPCL